jgi:5-formaminoimidazole-4-carboxamide-1-beta-D-ribofuranosyl 5'-monophosphate synthetase
MQEIAKTYRKPVALITGSSSGLEAATALKRYGLRTIIYVVREEVPDCIKKLTYKRKQDLNAPPNSDIVVLDDLGEINRIDGWKTAVLQLNTYFEITKYVDELIALECVQIPSRTFSVLVGGDEKCSIIENQFAVPIMGSRNVFKIARIGVVEKDYRWFAQEASVPCVQIYKFKASETGIRFTQFIDEPVALMTEYLGTSEKGVFIIGENSSDLEERVTKEISAGNIDKATLERARVQQFLLGLDANLNFFFSPIDAKEEWGDTDDVYAKLYNLSLQDARACLANEFISIDERRVDILKKSKDLSIEFQKRVKSFIKSYHLPKVSLNFSEEFLFENLLKYSERLFLLIKEKEPPGIIGSWSLQTTMLQKDISSYQLRLTGINFGLYDGFEEEIIYPLVDLAKLRRGMEMTLGERTALELYKSKKEDMLPEIVT